MDRYQLTIYSVGISYYESTHWLKWEKAPTSTGGTLWNNERTDVKNIYTIRNLATQHEYIADVTHLKPFYHDRTYVVPLNIAVKDTDEYRRPEHLWSQRYPMAGNEPCNIITEALSAYLTSRLAHHYRDYGPTDL